MRSAAERRVRRPRRPSLAMGIALCAWLTAAVGPSSAHETHATLAELGIEEAQGRIEVALYVETADLVDELTRRAGRVVVPEAVAADSSIVALLVDHFVVLGHDGEPLTLTWVGKEIEPLDSWLYFTFSLPDGEDPVGGLTLRNTFGTAAHARQLNTVKVTWRGRTLARVFTREKESAALWPAPDGADPRR